MVPTETYIREHLAHSLAPWTYPYYCWAVAWNLWFLNYCTVTEMLSPPKPSKT